jgi:hypothetical protein
MIFCSFSLKYPFGFHQLFVLVGHCGIRKNDSTPTRTSQQLVRSITPAYCSLTSEGTPKAVRNVDILLREIDLLN